MKQSTVALFILPSLFAGLGLSNEPSNHTGGLGSRPNPDVVASPFPEREPSGSASEEASVLEEGAPTSVGATTSPSTDWEDEVNQALSGLKQDVVRIDGRLNQFQTSLTSMQKSIHALSTEVKENKETLIEIKDLVIKQGEELAEKRKALKGESPSKAQSNLSLEEKMAAGEKLKYLVTEELRALHKTSLYHHGRGLITAYKVNYYGKERFLDENGYLIPPCPITGNSMGISPRPGDSAPSSNQTAPMGTFTMNSSYGTCYTDASGRRVCPNSGM